MPDFDPSDPAAPAQLTDEELRSEIELVGELVVAASYAPGPLSQEEIDRLLGVDGGPKEPDSGDESVPPQGS